MTSSKPSGYGLNEMIPRLSIAVPEFNPDANDVRDGLNYPVFNDLMRFVEGLDLGHDDQLLHKVFDFLENAVREGDDAVVEVVRDALWGLATWTDVNLYKPLMGRKSRALLRDVNME